MKPGFADHSRAGRRDRIVLVSRHPGAAEWLKRRGIEPDEHQTHFHPARAQPGDVVIGTLPLHLAAGLCSRGIQVIGLVIDTPPEWRGQELTSDQIEAANGRLHRFSITDHGPWQPRDSDER